MTINSVGVGTRIVEEREREIRCVLTSGEGVHQSWVRVGGVSGLLFGLANLGVTFSKLQPDGLWHVGVKPYALLQNCPQK